MCILIHDHTRERAGEFCGGKNPPAPNGSCDFSSSGTHTFFTSGWNWLDIFQHYMFVYFFVSAGVWSGGPLTFCLSISLWRLSKLFAAGNAFICFCCLYSTMIPKGIVIWEIEDNKLIPTTCLCDKLTCSVLLCRWQKGLSSQQKIKWRKMMQNINF